MRHLLLLAVVLCSSCVVPDVDRTQPNKIRKSVFAGEWYYVETVVDVPYSTSFTFIGEQTERTERVRFDVQEGYLIAYRSYALVAGTGGEENAPVAVFPIESHFDVKRDYNAATGEQSNVLVENTSDRPWYEREWVRVDWSTNLAPNFLFAAQNIQQIPGSHYVQDPADPDSLLVSLKGDDGAWLDHQGDAIATLATADYIDVVHRILATPETIYVEDWDGTIYEEPACWYYTNADCTPSEITVRSAFKKVEDDGYVLKEYPDNELLRDEDGEPIRVSYATRDDLVEDPEGFEVRVPYFDKFGYFRTERERYDRRHGETQSGKIHLINRWNIWRNEAGCVDPDAAATHAACTVEPIRYHLTAGFPEDLEDEAARAIAQWNEAFKIVVNQLKYGGQRDLADVEDVVTLSRNTWKVDGAGRTTDRGQRIGDLRYNLLAWIDAPNQVGLLGYGPSATDPLTGRIIAGNAFQYGAGVDEYAQYATEIVELANDPDRFAEFIEGDDVEHSVWMATADDPSPRERTRDFVQKRVNAGRAKDVRAMGTRVLESDPSRTRARLEAIRDTPLEQRLAVDPLRRALSGTQSADPAALDGVPTAVASPANWAMGQAFRKERLRRNHLMKRSMTHTRYFDPSVIGAALRLRDLPSDEIWAEIRGLTFGATTEHELGHTFGLRHNFEASTDALNYGREYWDLKGTGAQPLEAPTDDQLEAGIREHQYASIMDYGSRFMSDVHGIGSYDRAAIAFGYGDLVEVFEGAPDTNLLDVMYLQDILKGFQHYTKLPEIFGGIDGMHARRFVPYQDVVDQMAGRSTWDLWEVPYRFCSDEYEGATSTCAVFDEGADAYEIALAARTQYVEYFPFLSFSRDRRYFNEWDYMDRVFSRTFFPLLTQYQNWVFDGFNDEYYYDCLVSDDAACDDVDRDDDAVYYGLEAQPWALSGDGGLAGAAAARLLLDTIGEVLAQPEPGSYTYDAQDGILWAYSYYEDPQCPPGQIDDSCSELNVPFGLGRYTDSLWDVESGYTFYDRLKMVGSFYDKLIALETAVTSDTYFLGVDTGAQVNRYAIGLSLYFPEEIHRLVGGTSAEDYPVYSGWSCSAAPGFVPPKLSDLDAPKCEGGAYQHVDPATSFTVELYAIWYGMAFLPFGFDLDFNDRMKIWLDGAGEQFTPADPTLVVTFTNPLNNRVYKATRAADPNAYSPAAALLARAQRFADDYALDPSTNNLYRLQNLVTTIEDVRGTYDIYGTFYF